MKITKIEQDGNIFTVTTDPSFIGRVFGFNKKTDRYRDTGETFLLGGGSMYINESGECIGNLCRLRKSIDEWRRRSETWEKQPLIKGDIVPDKTLDNLAKIQYIINK